MLWIWFNFIELNGSLRLEVGFPGGSMIKNPLPMQETQFWFLGWEDPLDKEMAIHSVIIAWEIPWTEEPGRLHSMGS